MNHRRGISDNFGRFQGYRVLILESWHCGPGNFEIHIQKQTPEGTLYAKPVEIVFEKVETQNSYAFNRTPFLRVDDAEDLSHFGGGLMQALERAFLPAGESRPEAIEAINKHLQDMRALVFKTEAPK